MGATAISSVTPSGPDAAQDLVEVEAGGGAARSRPARRAASRFSSPRMWAGGVAIWKTSSGPRPERRPPSGSVATAIERWVWRTALGSPVVPELNTSTASSSAAGSGDAERRPVAVGRQRVDGRRR